MRYDVESKRREQIYVGVICTQAKDPLRGSASGSIQLMVVPPMANRRLLTMVQMLSIY